MSPYIIAGYVVALSTLSLYGVTLLFRVRAARRRLKVVEVDDRASGQRGGGSGAVADAP